MTMLFTFEIIVFCKSKCSWFFFYSYLIDKIMRSVYSIDFLCKCKMVAIFTHYLLSLFIFFFYQRDNIETNGQRKSDKKKIQQQQKYKT